MERACIENTRRINELEMRVAEETARNEAEHESYKRRLKELDENAKQQNGILITLQRQADAIETMNVKLDNVAERIIEIEKEPADKWKKLGFEIVKYITIGAVGVVAGVVMNNLV